MAIRAHAGDWRQAARLYGQWFRKNFKPIREKPGWARARTAFQNTMFLLPEGNVNVRFADIPRWAQDAADCGIRSLLISGFNVGGHDRGYPDYSPDPRLGAWDELAQGIRKCHSLGMKVSFFMNIHPVDMATDWYRRELHKFAARARDQTLQEIYGWGMGTVGARINSTQARLVFANPAFEEYRRIIVDQVRRLAAIGADGVHIDKAFPAALDFNPGLSAPPDQAACQGYLKCFEEILLAGQRENPEFCISYEGWWDRFLTCSDLVWWAPDDVPVLKYAFPNWTACIAVRQPYDFNVVNLAALRAYHILIGPANYTRSMSYAPMKLLCRYVGEITRIRDKFVNVLSLGEALDDDELRLNSPATPSGQLRGAVYRDAVSGRRGAVIVNFSRGEVGIRASLPSASGRVQLIRPFCKPQVLGQEASFELDAERLAFLIEE
jgi:hypothetical protein